MKQLRNNHARWWSENKCHFAEHFAGLSEWTWAYVYPQQLTRFVGLFTTTTVSLATEAEPQSSVHLWRQMTPLLLCLPCVCEPVHALFTYSAWLLEKQHLHHLHLEMGNTNAKIFLMKLHLCPDANLNRLAKAGIWGWLLYRFYWE